MVKTIQHTFQLIAFFILVVALAACGGSETANPVPNTDDGSATEIAAVETAVPPTATATLPSPVVPTMTLPPPAVVNDEPTPTHVPEPTATPAPVALYSAADFGTDRNPLTG
ncbi:MAG: hypothetical protein KDD45_04095, partial [Bdellovibrionales bacterium]|nr:hypothetical protein [Bdellovibrionales bacterium]